MHYLRVTTDIGSQSNYGVKFLCVRAVEAQHVIDQYYFEEGGELQQEASLSNLRVELSLEILCAKVEIEPVHSIWSILITVVSSTVLYIEKISRFGVCSSSIANVAKLLQSSHIVPCDL